MISRKSVEVVCALLALFASSTAALGNQFIALGDLPGGGFGSSAFGVSADGRVVVGGSTAENQTGFIWTDATGMQPIPGMQAQGVSADGKTVVGSLFNENIGDFGAYQAMAWDAEHGIQNLHTPLAPWPDLPLTYGEATEASYDGKVIVGAAGDDGHFSAFRYTPTDGMERLINFDGVEWSNANDVSDDGQVIVGTVDFEGSAHNRAYRWNQNEGATLLPRSLLGTPTEARAISADGKFTVGVLDTGQGYRWDETTGLVSLSLLPGYPNSSGATVVTGSGEAVLGLAGFGSDDALVTPYLWTSERGIAPLQEVLANEFGLEDQLQGWRLIQPLAITADGRSIAGLGSNPNGMTEAWLVRLDQPIFVPEPGVTALAAFALLASALRPRRR